MVRKLVVNNRSIAQCAASVFFVGLAPTREMDRTRWKQQQSMVVRLILFVALVTIVKYSSLDELCSPSKSQVTLPSRRAPPLADTTKSNIQAAQKDEYNSFTTWTEAGDNSSKAENEAHTVKTTWSQVNTTLVVATQTSHHDNQTVISSSLTNIIRQQRHDTFLARSSRSCC